MATTVETRGAHPQAPPGARPKLVLVITLAEVGGAQTYVASLLPAVCEAFDVVVAAHGPGPLAEAARAHGARYVPLRNVRRPINPWHDLAGLVELVRLFRRERPQVVHANSSKAGILGRLAGVLARVPSRVFTVHGWAFSAASGPSSLLYLWLDRLLRPATSLVICVSHRDRELGVRKRTCRADRSVVIWNAVDVAAAPKAARAGDPPVLVSVGRLRAPKDFGTLLKALALLPRGSFRARIAGAGPDLEFLLEQRARLGLAGTVEFLGERPDVPELLASADVFVLPSTSEGLPISVIEAMAAGLPVLASEVGGVPELVVDGETGLLVPPRDPAALAAALARLLADPRLRDRMGDAGLERARRHFDLPGFRASHLDAYGRLLATRVTGARRYG